MRKRDKRIERIRQLPPFTTARPHELRQLAAVADLVMVDAGQVLCRADRRALEVYIVVDGIVDVVAGDTVLASLRRGQIIGELGLLDGQPRSADVVAATDVTVLVIPARAMWPLLDTSHAMRVAVLRQLADRVRKADEDLAAAS